MATSTNNDKMLGALQTMFKDHTSSVPDWEEQLIKRSGRNVMFKPAMVMLERLGLLGPTAAPFRLLDNGCGSGSVCEIVHSSVSAERLRDSTIFNADFSQQMVDLVAKRARDEGWGNVECGVHDAEKTGFPDNTFTHLTANFVYHMVPNSLLAVADSIRVLQPGGRLGITTWHDSNLMWSADTRSAFASFPFDAPFPAQAPVQLSKDGEWGDVNFVRWTLEHLEDVQVTAISFLDRVESGEHFVQKFGMMLRWIMNSEWSEEQRGEHGVEEVQRLVAEHLDGKYGGRPWDLTCTAIVATGRKKAE